MKPVKSPFDTSTIKKGLEYVKYNGLSGVMSKVRYKMTGPGLAYNGWYKEKHEPDEEELLRQREDMLPYSPRISILVPLYLTPELYLRAMIESVRNQTYSNWELCIVDGSQAKVGGMPETEVTAYDFVYSLETERIIREIAEEDSRIKYILLKQNQGICGSLDMAIELATGEYVAFLNHDDLLTEDALYEIAKACNEKPYDFLYSDEDKCSSDGSKYSDPTFKPDFSIDLMRAYNYFGHLVAVKRSIAMSVSFRSEFEGTEDYDFNLRCIETCVEGFPDNPLKVLADRTLGRIKEISVKPLDVAMVKHIPRVLYHSRIKPKSLDDSGHKRNISGELARKALSQHLDRTVGYATAVRTDMKGVFKVQYETPGNPKVSIVIPGGDDPALMEKCIVPLFEKARYSDFEIIIVDTIGDENLSLNAFYRKMEAQRKNITVITAPGLKNTAEIRNVGAKRAKGDFLLFLDNTTELLDVTAIGDMVGNCLRDEVGIVGGTLYTTSGAIHKQGIVLGVNGVVAYPNRGIKKGNLGYLMNNCINGNYLAVPAACMMVKTVIYDKVGGFDERFTGDAAAVDFCLKARETGVQVVTVADAGWTYADPVRKYRSSGIDADNERMLKEKWTDIFENSDPYYNVNFTRNGDMFSL